jgi:hypothetical protein
MKMIDLLRPFDSSTRCLRISTTICGLLATQAYSYAVHSGTPITAENVVLKEEIRLDGTRFLDVTHDERLLALYVGEGNGNATIIIVRTEPLGTDRTYRLSPITSTRHISIGSSVTSTTYLMSWGPSQKTIKNSIFFAKV